MKGKTVGDMTKDEVLSLLRVYGDHRWKCAVSRALRDEQLCPPCDCGWQEFLAGGWWKNDDLARKAAELALERRDQLIEAANKPAPDPSSTR